MLTVSDLTLARDPKVLEASSILVPLATGWLPFPTQLQARPQGARVIPNPLRVMNDEDSMWDEPLASW